MPEERAHGVRYQLSRYLDHKVPLYSSACRGSGASELIRQICEEKGGNRVTSSVVGSYPHVAISATTSVTCEVGAVHQREVVEAAG